MREVKLSWRQLNIDYNVDLKSVTELSEYYGVDFQDMKKALRNYGFTIRKGEPAPKEPTKDYTIVLVDTDKIVVEEAVVLAGTSN